MSAIRLNKYLASQGIASRRKIDDLIAQGRVFINNSPAHLGDKVDPTIDAVRVDKRVIPPTPQTLVYYALNKPKYVLSTTRDEHGRDTVINYVPKGIRVFPVGRLDFESTGLLLLTNDGDLTLKLTHPSYHSPKIYLVTVLGKLPVDKIFQFEHGVMLEDGKTAPTKLEVKTSKLNQTSFELTLFEGKNRQIRRMCVALHLHLMDLHRLTMGPITLGDLAIGKYRPLTSAEIIALKK